MDLLSASRIAVAVAMLCGAAVLDLRSRRVRNGYWFPFVAAAGALLAIDLGLHGPFEVGPALAAAGLVAGLAYAAFWYRLFGGADAKAIMVLAFLVPTLPAHAPLPIPFAIDTLMDASLAAALFPFGLLAWNLAHGRWRLPAAFIGYPMPLDQARRAHVWPMQRVLSDGGLAWKYWGFVGMDADAEYERLTQAGISHVWVTAKIPFVAFLAIGAIAATLWGNLLLAVARTLAA